MWSDGDTITAIATPKGTGALGIVRISGPHTPRVVSSCFFSKTYNDQESHKAHYGQWKDPVSMKTVDEVVLIHYNQGRGFTGEASCEVICHGGPQVVDLVLDAAIKGGARLARPGEFTYRAVMNGRMDLAQAEAVLDLISARSPKAAQQAIVNIQGGLSRWLINIEERLTKILANLEASIDFTTEDIQPFDYPTLSSQTKSALEALDKVLDTHVNSHVVKQGLRVVIVGKPNVGKSSVLNNLLGRQRSIVTDQPGTTRDAVEVDILVNQSLVTLVDTAGIRESTDLVENLGIERTRHELQNADVIVIVADGSLGFTNDDVSFIKSLPPDRIVVCVNKSDLRKWDQDELLKPYGLIGYKVVFTCALEPDGTNTLREILGSFFGHNVSPDIDAVISTPRQKEGLLAARGFLERAITLLDDQSSQELVSLEMTSALRQVQAVLGKDPQDEIMDQVFKDFCIGK